MSLSRQSAVYRLVASAIVLLLALLAIEGAVRLAGVDSYFENRFFVLNRALDYPDVFLRDPELFWRFRPGQTITSRFFEGKTYRINSDGLRGPEISRTDDKSLVILLGNSCMFGWGVDYENSVAGQLATMVGEDHHVANAGIPGYSSFQGRILFERQLAALQPDVVVVMFGWNDQWAAASEIADKDQRFPPAVIVTVQNWLSQWHSYRLMKRLWLRSIEPDPDSLFDRQAPVYRVGLADFRDNLATISSSARDTGARVILITEPQPSNPVYGESVTNHPAVRQHQRYNRVVRELAARLGVELVDAAEAFQERDDLYDDPGWCRASSPPRRIRSLSTSRSVCRGQSDPGRGSICRHPVHY